MAVTKILQIKRSHKEALEYIMDFDKTNKNQEQQQAIDYIVDDLKTDHGNLVSGYNCTPDFSVAEFAMTQELAREVKGNYRNVGGSDIKAHHIIQSFSPDDHVTPEEAHEIGRQLMNELLGGKHEFVIATHIDKEHIHNHIVFNATSFYSHTKFRCVPYKTAGQIRSISDKLCAEHGLSVLPEKQALKSSYLQYQKYRSQTTYRAEIRKRMNYLLEKETDLDSLVQQARELDVEINLEGKHVTYRYGAQKRNTRDDKLSDDNRFSKEGLIERLKQNETIIRYTEAAIVEAYNESDSMEAFENHLQHNAAILLKRNRTGEVVFHIQDTNNSKIRERALNSGYTFERISQLIGSNQSLEKIEDTESIKVRYEEQARTAVTDIDSPVILEEESIKEVTKDGILISADNGKGMDGVIFIDSNHVDYLSKEKKYMIHLGDQFNYYFMENGKQTNYFLKGETLLRQLETKAGVPTRNIQLSPKNIQSISEKGVNLTFESHGIDRLFLPKEYVHYDKLSKKVFVELSDNWNYYYQKEQIKEATKKMPYEHLKGKDLVAVIEEQQPTLDAHLKYKLNNLNLKLSVSQSKKMAESLSLLRRNKIKDIPELQKKIEQLANQVLDTRTSINEMQEKIGEYNQVAKYLLTYNKYYETKKEIENATFKKASLMKKFESELIAFDCAERELNERGINPHVDVEKVIDLVKENQKQEAVLQAKLDNLENNLERFKGTNELIAELNEDRGKEQTKTKQPEKDR